VEEERAVDHEEELVLDVVIVPVELAVEHADTRDAVVDHGQGLVPPRLGAIVGELAGLDDLERTILHVVVDVVGHEDLLPRVLHMNETLPFAQAVAGSDAEIDLAAAALLIAEREYPGLDVDRYRARLDDLAARARARGGDVEAVRHVLFADEGFAGNTGDYYDARNSFLNDVLDRRVGIPITLSVIFLEVAWRLGLAAEGIGYPGHFLVRVEGAILDCFNGGVAL